ncbi:hypothetical protein [Kitasatospora sp. HPMI-4]
MPPRAVRVPDPPEGTQQIVAEAAAPLIDDAANRDPRRYRAP